MPKILAPLVTITALVLGSFGEASAQIGIKTGERTTGLYKQCIYSVPGGQYIRTISSWAVCPVTIEVESNAPTALIEPAPAPVPRQIEPAPAPVPRTNAWTELGRGLGNLSAQLARQRAQEEESARNAALQEESARNAALVAALYGARTHDLYQRACADGDMTACTGLGIQYAEGRVVLPSYTRAAQLFQRACAGGDAAGCTRLREMRAGNPVAQAAAAEADRAQSVELEMERARTAEIEATRLREAAMEATRAREAALEANRAYAAAFEAKRLGCNRGDLRSCVDWGWMFADGHGVAQNERSAVGLFRRACNGREMRGCAGLGSMYLGGRGVPRSDGRAVMLFRQACNGGAIVGCYQLGLAYE